MQGSGGGDVGGPCPEPDSDSIAVSVSISWAHSGVKGHPDKRISPL